MKKGFFFLASLLVVSSVVACDSGGSGAQVQVTFEVTSAAPTIDRIWYWTDENTKVVLPPDVPLPWSYSFTGREGDWVELDAMEGAGIGATATIYKNGSVLYTASGGNVVVFVQGDL